MIPRISLILTLLLTLVGCQPGGGNTKNFVSLANGTTNEISFFADQTQSGKALEFSTDQRWSASVVGVEASASQDGSWLTLSPNNGEAGANKIDLKLQENISGVERRAIVRIVCGDATLDITIVQKAETASGQINTTVTIADEAFKAFLLAIFDVNKNGAMEISEMRAITEIYIEDPQIKSLEGIEHCVRLRDVTIYNSPISVFDFSFTQQLDLLRFGSPTASSVKITSSTLSTLTLMDVPKTTIVDAYQSENLTSLSLFNTSPASIDVTRFVTLDYLSLDEMKIDKLDLSKFSKLRGFTFTKVEIAELQISNPTVIDFAIWDSKIPSIDLSSCAKLEMVHFGGVNDIEHLNLGAANLPTNEDSSWGKFQLGLSTSAKKLTIESQNLEYITIEGDKLTQIDVRGSKALMWLTVNGVVASNVESAVKILAADKLLSLVVKKSRINDLDLTACPSLERFDLGLHFAENFVLKANEKLSDIIIDDGTWVGSDAIWSKTQAIALVGCVSVDTIECTGIQTLKSLDAASCVKLKAIDVRNNKLQSLVLPSTSTLETVRCDNNEIAALDFTGCSELYNIICTNNKIEELDVSMCDLRDIRSYPYPSYFPLECKMSSLKKVYIKKNAQINGISFRRDSDYIDDATEVEFR